MLEKEEFVLKNCSYMSDEHGIMFNERRAMNTLTMGNADQCRTQTILGDEVLIVFHDGS